MKPNINIYRWVLLLVVALLLVGCAGLKPNIAVPDQQPLVKTQPKPDVALVLGGGGARGYAHIGVIKALEQAGIPIDLVVGTSAGSMMGAIYADTGSAEELERIAMAATFWDYADIANIPLFGGVISGNHLEKFLQKNLHSEQFNQLKVPFVAVTTNLIKGDVYTIQAGPIPPAVLASAAIPGVVKPVHLYGKILVDGGVVDNVAVDIAERYHPKIIIAVDVSSDLDANVPGSSFTILSRSYDITLKTLSNMQLKNTQFVIRPKLGNVGMFDMSHNEQLVKQGYIAAQAMLPSIKQAIKEKGIDITGKQAG